MDTECRDDSSPQHKVGEGVRAGGGEVVGEGGEVVEVAEGGEVVEVGEGGEVVEVGGGGGTEVRGGGGGTEVEGVVATEEQVADRSVGHSTCRMWEPSQFYYKFPLHATTQQSQHSTHHHTTA